MSKRILRSFPLRQQTIIVNAKEGGGSRSMFVLPDDVPSYLRRKESKEDSGYQPRQKGRNFYPEVFVGRIYKNPPKEYSDSRMDKLKRNEQISREEELEIPMRFLQEMNLIGKPINLCHDNTHVVGEIVDQLLTDDNFYISYQIYKPEGEFDMSSKDAYEDILSDSMNALSLTSKESRWKDAPHETAVVEGIDVALCHEGARKDTVTLKGPELQQYHSDASRVSASSVVKASATSSSSSSSSPPEHDRSTCRGCQIWLRQMERERGLTEHVVKAGLTNSGENKTSKVLTTFTPSHTVTQPTPPSSMASGQTTTTTVAAAGTGNGQQQPQQPQQLQPQAANSPASNANGVSATDGNKAPPLTHGVGGATYTADQVRELLAIQREEAAKQQQQQQHQPPGMGAPGLQQPLDRRIFARDFQSLPDLSSGPLFEGGDNEAEWKAQAQREMIEWAGGADRSMGMPPGNTFGRPPASSNPYPNPYQQQQQNNNRPMMQPQSRGNNNNNNGYPPPPRPAMVQPGMGGGGGGGMRPPYPPRQQTQRVKGGATAGSEPPMNTGYGYGPTQPQQQQQYQQYSAPQPYSATGVSSEFDGSDPNNNNEIPMNAEESNNNNVDDLDTTQDEKADAILNSNLPQSKKVALLNKLNQPSNAQPKSKVPPSAPSKPRASSSSTNSKSNRNNAKAAPASAAPSSRPKKQSSSSIEIDDNDDGTATEGNSEIANLKKEVADLKKGMEGQKKRADAHQMKFSEFLKQQNLRMNPAQRKRFEAETGEVTEDEGGDDGSGNPFKSNGKTTPQWASTKRLEQEWDMFVKLRGGDEDQNNTGRSKRVSASRTRVNNKNEKDEESDDVDEKHGDDGPDAASSSSARKKGRTSSHTTEAARRTNEEAEEEENTAPYRLVKILPAHAESPFGPTYEIFASAHEDYIKAERQLAGIVIR